MKKIRTITTLLLALFSFTLSYAQTEEQTLEWLNVKKTGFTDFQIPNVEFLLRKWDDLVFYSDFIIGKDDDKSTKISWNEIKEIDHSNNTQLSINEYFRLSIKTSQGVSISFFGKDYSLIEKFAKALKHMATLKGAKLVDDDLF